MNLTGIVNLFVFYKHDDDTSKNVLNLSNYNKDGSSETAHFTWGTLGGERGMRETKCGVDGFCMAFDYICLSDFGFAHIVPLTPPPPPP